MFVRWKQYQGAPWWHRYTWGDGETALERLSGFTYKAYLVEARRGDGQVRQRVVRYLGSIRDGLNDPRAVGHREYFWQQARTHLDTVALDADARARCETTLATVVPPVTEAELDASKAAGAKARALLAMARRG